MPTFTGTSLAIALDVVIRVSCVLTASLLVAYTAKRNAALRHAVLVAGLVAAFIVPAGMLIMQVLPVSRLQLGLLRRTGLDGTAAVAAVSSQPPSESQNRPASGEHPAPVTARTGSDEFQLAAGHDASARSDRSSLGPQVEGGSDVPYGRSMAVVLLLTLLSGAIVKLTGLGFSLVRLRRIVARAHPITDEHVLSVLGLVQRRIPVRPPPRLLESAEVFAPVAAGVIGNYVLLPTGWAGSLHLDETLAVLSHESAHLARRDHRVVILQELLASALWFHPLVHLYNRMLNRVREELCDNYAIAMVDRASYCQTLLVLAAGRSRASLRCATSMWTGRWPLEDRVRGILDERRPTRTGISKVARWATATCLPAICGLVAMPQLIASPSNTAAADVDSLPSAEAGPVANQMTRSISRSFPVNAQKMLRFENLAGRVELVTAKGPMVKVEATVRVGELAERDAKRLIDGIQWVAMPDEHGEARWGLSFPTDRYPAIRYPVSGDLRTDSDTVRYLGREVRISNRQGDSTPSVEFDLRVSVPPGVRVAVDNAIGPIDAESVDSPLKLSTGHGGIRLGQVRAAVEAKSMHGDVSISELDSNAVVHTDHGDIVLSRVSQGHVSLSTGSGHCRIAQLPETGFSLLYTGGRPLEVIGGGVARASSRNGGRSSEGLVRGSGGPSITIATDTGAATVVVAQHKT